VHRELLVLLGGSSVLERVGWGGGALDLEQLVSSSRSFLGWAVDWYNGRPTLDLACVIAEAGGPENVAVLAVDITVGFCSQGALASERVAGIVEPIVQLFQRAHDLGVRHFVLPQDTHSEDALEFSAFPPHCVAGTDESVTMPELMNLPFSDLFTVIEKDSVCVAIDTELDAWLEAHPEVTAFITVGDCTDFCTHRMAMHLRLRANTLKHHGTRVILPVDSVDTFHIPVDVAEELNIMPHHGDLLHLIFLFNMAQNGVEVVARLV
jgi:nicotinamidase-related amidase